MKDKHYNGLILALSALLAVSQKSEAQLTTDDVAITEILAVNDSAYLSTNDKGFKIFPDVIEIQNRSTQQFNLEGYFLSDDPLNPQKWTFPRSFLQPGDFLVVKATTQTTQGLVANFKLSRNGESLLLSRPDGSLLQRVDFPAQQSNVSWARLSNGSYAYLSPASIGQANDDADSFTSFVDRPSTDQESGFYDNSITVTLSASAGAQIRYTLDGSQPNSSSTLYSAPLQISQTTVLKSIAVLNGARSDVGSRTFFIGANPHDLPVVIITADDLSFDRNENGVYGTYKLDGRVRLDFLETDGSLPISQYAEFQTSGLSSSIIPPFNGKIYARSRLGPGKLKHRFFPEKDEDSFNRILLRNTSQDFDKARMRDAVFSRIISEGDIVKSPHEGYRPAVAYLNGEYVGHINIREDDDAAFAKQYYGLAEPFTVGRSFDGFGQAFSRHVPSPFGPPGVGDQGSPVLPNRNSSDAIFRLRNLVNIDEALLDETLRSSLGVMEGTTFWRSANPNQADRTSLHDYDFSLNFFTPSAFTGPWRDVNWESPLTMTGEDTRFWHEAMQHAASYLQHMGYAERVGGIIDQIAAELRTEMPRTIAWYKSREQAGNGGLGSNDLPIVQNLAEWEEQVGFIRDYATSRLAESATGALAGEYGFQTMSVQISSADLSMGDVRVHGYRVLPGRENGEYIEGIPLRLEADAKPGFIFDGWTGDVPTGLQDNPAIEVTYNSGMTPAVQAVFLPSPLTLEISEIYYNPPGVAETDEFIELVNYGPNEIDLSGVSFSEGLTYTFPAGTTLAAGAYIVLRPTDYTGGLDNDGETLALIDTGGVEITSLTYNDVSPWPTLADNDGYSLVNISPGQVDGSESSSWRRSLSVGGNAGVTDSLPITDFSTAGLLSYAFGSETPPVILSPQVTGTFDLSFKKNVNADAVSLTLESSETLATNSWSSATAVISRSTAVTPDGQELVTFKLMSDLTKRFYRLQIQQR